MKNYKFILAFVSFSLFTISVKSQNVGIGQTFPTNTLHITPIVPGSEPLRVDALKAFSVGDTSFMVINPSNGVVRYMNISNLKTVIGKQKLDTSQIVSIIYNYGDTLLSNTRFITNLGDTLLNNYSFQTNLRNTLLGDSTFLSNLSDSIETDIDSLILTGTILTAYENGTIASVDLSSLSLKPDTSIILSLLYNNGDTLITNSFFMKRLTDSLLGDSMFLSNLSDSIETDIDSLRLTGTILTAYENGKIVSVDLKPLSDSINLNDWHTNGNLGTTRGVDFLGTIDSVPLQIKTNNIHHWSFREDGGIDFVNPGNNVFLGNRTGELMLPGSYSNVFIGNGAGRQTTAANSNVFIGSAAGINNYTGGNNTFIGHSSGFNNESGNENVNIGDGSGHHNKHGSQTVNVGFNAGYGNTTSTGNTNVGYKAAYTTYFGTNSVTLGSQAGYSALGLDKSVLVGSFAGYNAFIAENVLYLGYQSGFNSSSGSNNTFLGNKSGFSNTTGSGNVFIGNGSGGLQVTDSNLLFIANSDTVSPLIYGEFDNGLLKVNGKVQIENVSKENTVTSTTKLLVHDDASKDLKYINVSDITISSIKTVTSSYSVLSSDATILVDAAAGSVTITLPAPIVGKKYIIKKIDYSTNTVGVQTTGGALIEGLSVLLTLSSAMQTMVLQSDGINWYLIN